MDDVARVGAGGARGGGGACAWVLDLSGLVGGVAGVAASEDVGDESAWVSGSGSVATFCLEEAIGGVDGSVAAAQGERDSCDVRGGAGLDTGSSKVREF